MVDSELTAAEEWSSGSVEVPRARHLPDLPSRQARRPARLREGDLSVRNALLNALVYESGADDNKGGWLSASSLIGTLTYLARRPTPTRPASPSTRFPHAVRNARSTGRRRSSDA